jgi:HAE1 family hydrophobic/amphiphilic exporter-1
MGGMLFGTLIGVLVIPGLYFVFGKMIEGKSLIKDEAHSSLSEAYVTQESSASLLKKIAKLNVLLKANKRKNKRNEN